MELFGRQIPVLYIFLIPYVPFFLFLLFIFALPIFIWIVGDLITNFSLGFFSVFNMVLDLAFPRVKACPLSGGKKN